jgi:hypothetical protein
MIEAFLPNGRYAWSSDAFAQRVMNLLDSRNLTSPAQVIAALNGMAFNAAGWTTLKKIIAELVSGSVAFPGDINANGAVTVSELVIGTRDVSSTIT